jgi:hypothetical protein
MNAMKKVSLRWRFVGNVALFGLLALAGSGSRAFAQSTLQGEVTLPVEARFGEATLPAGTYKFTVQAVGVSQTINTATGATNQVLVSMTGLSKGTTIASVLGWATQQSARGQGTTDIRMEEAGNIFQSMYLDNVGMLIEFREGKLKNAMHAQAPAVSRVAANTAKGV